MTIPVLCGIWVIWIFGLDACPLNTMGLSSNVFRFNQLLKLYFRLKFLGVAFLCRLNWISHCTWWKIS